MAVTIRLTAAPDFRFAPTALSHGWCQLPPFRYDAERGTLARIEKLRDGTVVDLEIGAARNGAGLEIAVGGVRTLSAAQRGEIRRVVSHCLNAAQDLRPFYQRLRGQPRYTWVSRMRAGRLLISPTVWEDLVKTLLTTNTTWGATVQMCRRVVTLGDRVADGQHCFPAPDQIASMKLATLADRVRAGYRTAYLYELARGVAEGRVDVEAWRGNPELSSEELYRRVRGLKGFGDYATGTVLKLLGRFDHLGIDTVCRGVFRAQHNRGKPASDAKIRAHYEPFGEWRGMVLWMDVMSVHLHPTLRRGSTRAPRRDVRQYW